MTPAFGPNSHRDERRAPEEGGFTDPLAVSLLDRANNLLVDPQGRKAVPQSDIAVLFGSEVADLRQTLGAITDRYEQFRTENRNVKFAYLADRKSTTGTVCEYSLRSLREEGWPEPYLIGGPGLQATVSFDVPVTTSPEEIVSIDRERDASATRLQEAFFNLAIHINREFRRKTPAGEEPDTVPVPDYERPVGGCVGEDFRSKNFSCSHRIRVELPNSRPDIVYFVYYSPDHKGGWFTQRWEIHEEEAKIWIRSPLIDGSKFAGRTALQSRGVEAEYEVQVDLDHDLSVILGKVDNGPLTFQGQGYELKYVVHPTIDRSEVVLIKGFLREMNELFDAMNVTMLLDPPEDKEIKVL